eukprot:813016_1
MVPKLLLERIKTTVLLVWILVMFEFTTTTKQLDGNSYIPTSTARHLLTIPEFQLVFLVMEPDLLLVPEKTMVPTSTLDMSEFSRMDYWGLNKFSESSSISCACCTSRIKET